MFGIVFIILSIVAFFYLANHGPRLKGWFKLYFILAASSSTLLGCAFVLADTGKPALISKAGFAIVCILAISSVLWMIAPKSKDDKLIRH